MPWGGRAGGGGGRDICNSQRRVGIVSPNRQAFRKLTLNEFIFNVMVMPLCQGGNLCRVHVGGKNIYIFLKSLFYFFVSIRTRINIGLRNARGVFSGLALNFLVPQWRLCRWPSVSTHYKTALSSQHPALIVFINKLNSGPFLFQPKWVPLQFLTRTQSNQTNGMIYTSRSLVSSLIHRMRKHTPCCFGTTSKKGTYFFHRNRCSCKHHTVRLFSIQKSEN